MTAPTKRIPGLNVTIRGVDGEYIEVAAEIFGKPILSITATSKEDVAYLFEQLSYATRITSPRKEGKRTFEAAYWQTNGMPPKGVGASPYNGDITHHRDIQKSFFFGDAENPGSAPFGGGDTVSLCVDKKEPSAYVALSNPPQLIFGKAPVAKMPEFFVSGVTPVTSVKEPKK